MTAKDDRQSDKPADDDKVRRTSVPVDAEEVAHERPLRWSLMTRLLGFVAPYKLRMAWNVCLMAVGSGLGILGAVAVRQVIHYIELGKAYQTSFTVWVIVLVLDALAVWQMYFVREVSLVKLGQRVLFDLRMTIFKHLQKQLKKIKRPMRTPEQSCFDSKI